MKHVCGRGSAKRCGGPAAALAAACLGWAAVAGAHSASDAYLDVTVTRGAGKTAVLRGQWDIALRDLDFVLDLDDDGDGHLTWREVRRHREAIARYAFAHLGVAGGAGHSCRLEPGAQLIDTHADGAYAALFFEVSCTRTPQKLGLDYALFFGIDPSHRAIVVLHDGDQTSTALLSPEHARIEVPL